MGSHLHQALRDTWKRAISYYYRILSDIGGKCRREGDGNWTGRRHHIADLCGLLLD